MILYISKAFETNIAATMHLNALREFKGENEVFIIDLRPGEQSRHDNYIAYGKYRSAVDRIARWAQGNMMFISNSIISDICGIVQDKKIDTVFIEDSVFGNLVRCIKKRCPEVRVLSVYHDIKADLYPQWIKQGSWVSRIEFGIGIRQEWVNQKFADCNIVFHKRDADLFEKHYGRRPDQIMAISAPTPDFKFATTLKIEQQDKSHKRKLLFVGKNYFPNIVGLKWFYEKVMPHLTNHYILEVVGRGLEYLSSELTDSHVRVIGGVESLDGYYRDADIVIAPLFDGGGMKLKTVEAVSYGKTFVGTDESLVGFWEAMDDTIRNKSVFLCNTPEEWIEKLNALITGNTQKFNPELFDLFVKKFSYESSVDRLRQLIEGDHEAEANIDKLR